MNSISHKQSLGGACPYSRETDHGYECVEFLLGKYCEVGDGCLPECEFSWPAETMPKELAEHLEKEGKEYIEGILREVMQL